MDGPSDSQPKRGLRASLYQGILLAVVMFSSLGCYLAVLKWRGGAVRQITQTEWDRRIPFVVGWLWVYLVPYLIGPLTATVLRRETFFWYLRRSLLLSVVSLLIFALYPTQTVRPSVVYLGHDFTTEMYRNMVAIDEPPANAAPSLHVSLTCLLAWAVSRDSRRWGVLAFAVSGFVWLATLFTHQHHLIDVGTGVLLASLCAIIKNGYAQG